VGINLSPEVGALEELLGVREEERIGVLVMLPFRAVLVGVLVHKEEAWS